MLADKIAELERRRGLLADPQHVQTPARERLRYVLPGEAPVSGAASTRPHYYRRRWRDRPSRRYRRCPRRPHSRGSASSGSRSIGGEPVDRAELGGCRRAAGSVATGHCGRSRTASACGLPCVVQTQPRLDDGAPLPTLYGLNLQPPRWPGGTDGSCRREMQEMTKQLAAADPVLAQACSGAPRTSPTWPSATQCNRWAPKSARVACRTGSNACTSTSRTPWPAALASTPASATKR